LDHIILTNQVSLNFEGTVAGEEINISLIDVTGRVIQSSQIITGESSHLAQVNLANLNSGIYMLHVSGNRYDVTQKIIKK